MRPSEQWQMSDGGVLVPGIPTDSLVWHYTMDAISGSTVTDEQGSYNGTISGATDGGGYLSLDGVNDKVDNALSTKPQTFAWFVDITPDVIGDNDTIIGFVGGYGAAFVRFNATGLIRFYLYNGTFTILSGSVDSGNNYRVLAQHNGTDSELWVNGVEVDSAADVGSILYHGGESGRRIGGDYALSSGRFYDGNIYEALEYSRMVTPSEIALHFS